MKKRYGTIILICCFAFHTMQFAMQQEIPASFESLRTAMINNRIDTMTNLLQDHALDQFLNSPDESGATLLHLAVMANSAYAVKMLIDHGADVNALDNDGNSPLSLFQFDSPRAIFNLLLKAKADPRTINNNGVNLMQKIETILNVGNLDEFDRESLIEILRPLQAQAGEFDRQDAEQAEQARMLRQAAAQELAQQRREHGRHLVQAMRAAEQDREDTSKLPLNQSTSFQPYPVTGLIIKNGRVVENPLRLFNKPIKKPLLAITQG